MSTKITIEINGNKIELTPSEARRLYDDLRGVFGESREITYPPIIIDRQPPTPFDWTDPICYPMLGTYVSDGSSPKVMLQK